MTRVFISGCALMLAAPVAAQLAPPGAENPSTAPVGDAARQQPSAAPTPGPPATAPAPPEPQESPALVEARAHYDKGKALFDAANYEAAVAEFERAYELAAGHPRRFDALYNLGVTHERLFRYGRARTAYARYLDESKERAPDAAAVRARIDALEGLLAELVIEVNVASEVWIDDVLVGEAPGAVLFPAGRHTLVLHAQGYENAQREITIAARASHRLSFQLDPIGPREGLSPAFFWTSATLAIAGLTVGTVLGLDALDKSATVKDRADDPVDSARNRQPHLDAVDEAALRADLVFGVGAAFALTAGLLYFMTDWEDPSGPPPPRVGATIGSRRAALVIAGSL